MNAPTSISVRPTLAAWLLTCAPDDEQVRTLRRLRRQVVAPLLLVSVLVGLWCAWAPLSGAVVASGQVQAALGRKVVQHQEGGIVRSLLVRQGQAVRRGDPLLVVGDVRSDAALDMLRKQTDAERLRSERARAEMSLVPAFTLPADLTVSPEMLARERALFDSRRRTLDEQLAAMQSQAQQARAQIAALSGQLQASQRSAQLAREELGINSELVASGFVSKARLLMLERTVADTAMRAEASRGQIAEAQQQVSALANAMAQARGAYQQRAADELKEASARLRELEDRLRPSQDQFDRQTVRAPVDGTVMALRVGAVGTAVGPREPLLEIAPSQERLVVELRIDPHDIEHVREGDAAEVRLSVFEARSTPLLPAVVTSVSPDAVTESGGKQAWYAAQVEVKAEALAAHPQLRLQAGMPAEVFVTTPPRSLLRYLLEPLGVFGRRALREP
ncbi:MAG TPA: HlyD family type I secretion periplasmic adaptor subunit [Albitalea sp.]